MQGYNIEICVGNCKISIDFYALNSMKCQNFFEVFSIRSKIQKKSLTQWPFAHFPPPTPSLGTYALPNLKLISVKKKNEKNFSSNWKVLYYIVGFLKLFLMFSIWEKTIQKPPTRVPGALRGFFHLKFATSKYLP